jgi:hypothetical protein
MLFMCTYIGFYDSTVLMQCTGVMATLCSHVIYRNYDNTVLMQSMYRLYDNTLSSCNIQELWQQLALMQ